MKRIVNMVLLLLVVFSIANVYPVQAAPTAIEVWSPLTGNRAAMFDQFAQEFNQSQDDVVVTVIHQGGYDLVRQKMAAAASARNMPQMVLADYIDVPLYVQRNILKPIGEVLSQDVIDDLYPGMLVDLTVDGTLYGVPYNRTTQGLIVNTDLLKEAGIDRVASTWDEYYEDAVKFKEAMGEDYYYGYAFFNQYIFEAIAHSFGATFATPDGTAMMTEEPMQDLFRFFRKMYEEDLLIMVPTTAGGFVDQHSTFLEGKVATVFQSSSFIPSAEDLLDHGWSFEYIPAGAGGHAITIGGTNLVVTSVATDEELEAARAFIEFVTSPEKGATVFVESAQLPVRQSTLEVDFVQEYMAENGYTRNLMSQLDYAHNASAVTKNVGNVYSTVNDMIVRLIYNGENIERTLGEYNETFQYEFDDRKMNDSYIY